MPEGSEHGEARYDNDGSRCGDRRQPALPSGSLPRAASRVIWQRAKVVVLNRTADGIESAGKTLLGPGHESSPSCLARAAIARAAVDLTVPWVIPSVAAICASDMPR